MTAQPSGVGERLYSGEINLISATDPDSYITYANSHFCDVAGYESHELLDKPHDMVRHGDMPKAAFKQMWDYLKAGRSWMGLVKNRCKDGGHYWVSAFFTPITDQQGNTVEYQSVCSKPQRQDVARAEKAYTAMRNEQTPRRLKFPRLTFTSTYLLLTGVSAAAVGLSAERLMPALNAAIEAARPVSAARHVFFRSGYLT